LGKELLTYSSFDFKVMRTFQYTFTSFDTDHTFPIKEEEAQLVFRDIEPERFDVYNAAILVTYLKGSTNIHSDILVIKDRHKTPPQYPIPEGISHVKINIGFKPIEKEQCITLKWEVHPVT
jgi:hypothetical protein